MTWVMAFGPASKRDTVHCPKWIGVQLNDRAVHDSRGKTSQIFLLSLKEAEYHISAARGSKVLCRK